MFMFMQSYAMKLWNGYSSFFSKDFFLADYSCFLIFFFFKEMCLEISYPPKRELPASFDSVKNPKKLRNNQFLAYKM